MQGSERVVEKKPSKESIARQAREVLKRHNLYQVPVDPVAVANALGVKVHNAMFTDPNISGVIASSGGTSVVYVKKEDSNTRKRFTIGHEVGHHLLHVDSMGDCEIVDSALNFRPAASATDFDYWDDEMRREWEANLFAACLLMDEELLRGEVGGKSVEDLALQFQVSEQAMRIRLEQLGVSL